ncbi:TPA: nuclease domain-containing protein, partial [Proteus mirabilis]
MANLRKEARGRECQIRIPGVCNGNSETVVLAHYRMSGICGTGIKPNDIFGAWA